MTLDKDQIKRAIADGFSNGNEQYDDASEPQRDRYDMAADAVLMIFPSPDGADAEQAAAFAPDGWTLVPNEATEEMLSQIAGCRFEHLSPFKQRAERSAYGHLLAISPAPPAIRISDAMVERGARALMPHAFSLANPDASSARYIVTAKANARACLEAALQPGDGE